VLFGIFKGIAIIMPVFVYRKLKIIIA